MNNFNAFIQVRMSSSRFPQKALKELDGISMLEFMYRRVQQSELIDQVIIVTSTDSQDDEIEKVCTEKNIPFFRGNLDDVLDRFYKAYQKYPSKNIVRLTGDCPLIDPVLIDQVLSLHTKEDSDYTSNINPPTYPDGFDVEVMTANSLEKIWEIAKDPKDREHVTYYIRMNEGFKKSNLSDTEDNSHLRVTVDYKEDLELVQNIINQLGHSKLDHKNISQFLNLSEENRSINKQFKRNEALPELD